MNKKTLKALKASIKHWEDNVAAERFYDVSIFSSDCDLCNLFAGRFCCSGCPVCEAGFEGCVGTPYQKCRDSFPAKWTGWDGDFKAFHKAAKEELAFLKSLLPEKE